MLSFSIPLLGLFLVGCVSLVKRFLSLDHRATVSGASAMDDGTDLIREILRLLSGRAG